LALVIASGNNQTGVINALLPNPLVVRVQDQNGSPLSGAAVTWSATSGSLSAASTTTTSDGQASVTLTLGATPGPVTVTASVSGSSVEFHVNNATQSVVTASLNQAAQLGNLAITTATVQSTNISLRLASLRAGQRGLSLKGLALNMGGQPVPVAALASLFPTLGGGGGASADQPAIFNRLGIFLNGQGAFGDQNARGGEPGFDFHTIGTTLGADYRFTDRFILGTAFGYVSTKANFDASAGDFSARGFSASVFGTYFVQDEMYVDAIATYGRNNYDTTRNITFPGISASAKGDPNGDQFALSVGGGYNFNAGGLMFGPTGRVNYTRVDIDEFRETGAGTFNVNVGDQAVRSVTIDLGGRISYAISTPWGVLLPSAHAEWEHEFRGGSRIITGSLVADPAQTLFSVQTNDPDRNYGNVGAALTATLKGGKSAFVSYEAVAGRSDFIQHTFNAGVRLEF
jgi:outer membrane autotransporter protein